MAYVSKVWVDRQTEYPTRRKLAFDDGTGDKIVTVSREEGQIYEAGDIFDANTMNTLESRIAAGIAEKQDILIPGNGIRIDQDNVISATGGGGGIEFTKIESGSLVSVNDAADLPVVDLAVEIKAVQSGTGDPSPSNVRPISGWSSVGVTRAKKNLYQYPYVSTLNLSGSGQNRTVVDSTITRSSIIPLKPGATYTLSGNRIGASDTFGRLATFSRSPQVNDVSIRFLSYSNNNSVTFTAADDELFALVLVSNGPTEDCHMQLEVGSTPTTYEPYVAPTTVTIALWQTVFGSSLYVTSGVLTITWAKYKLSDLSWNYTTGASSPSGKIFSSTTISGDVDVNARNIMCSIYKGTKVTYTSQVDNYCISILSDGRVTIRDDDYDNDIQSWITQYGDIEFIVQIATPVTVQLSGTEFETILGINNIWADSGDILNLEYYTQSASDVRDFIIKDDMVSDQSSWSSDKITEELDTKQDIIEAGDGIVINGNEISAVLYKELTATLNVFSTSVVFEDSAITTSSVIDIYTSKYGFNPETVTAETGRLTITFRQPEEQITVKVRIS